MRVNSCRESKFNRKLIMTAEYRANDNIPRDFGSIGSGIPAFLRWCFHTPWREPNRPLRNDKKYVDLYDLRSHALELCDKYMKCVTRQRNRRDYLAHTLDPRAYSTKEDFIWSLYRCDEIDSPLRHYHWFREITVLCQDYRDNDGFLSAEPVLRFVKEWGSVVPSNYMLDLLRAIPRSSLMSYRYNALAEALTIVFKRFVNETVCPPSIFSSLMIFHGIGFFLDEGSGRVWLQVPTTEFYSKLVPKLLTFSQLSIESSKNQRNQVRERLAIISKTLFVLTIARLSNDFFTDDFVDILRDGEITKLYRRGMQSGAILAMLPYSLFVSRAVVEKECARYKIHDYCEILQTCLEYMLLLRGRNTRSSYDASSHFIIEGTVGRLKEKFDETKNEIFFPTQTLRVGRRVGSKKKRCYENVSDDSSLTLRSLECMLRENGLERTLPTLLVYNLPKTLFVAMHRYFAGLMWNYLSEDHGNAW